MNLTIAASESGQWWDLLVKTSPQGSIFNTQWYLDALLIDHTFYKVTNNSGEILAGFCILEDSPRLMSSAPYLFTPYQGILFSKKISEIANHKKNRIEFEISKYIIEWLSTQYRNISMSFSPNFNDIRAFNWYLYGDLVAEKFSVKTKYTAYLDLVDFSLDNYLLDIRSVRRQEFRKNISLRYEEEQIDNFLDNYKKTFTRQAISLSEVELNLARSIVTAALNNHAGLLKKIVINDDSAASSLFLYDKNTGYYLFGANNPLYRSTGASTALMIRNIEEIASMGCKIIDFVGVNSPNRGDYKLSFNGSLKPYFQVDLNI